MTLSDKYEKIWPSLTSVKNMTLFDKCEKDMTLFDECEKYDTLWQVWKNMTLFDKCEQIWHLLCEKYDTL